ncbi:hypothetical protein EVAR_3474_1 [Eumeta japonica]|uniref:Uncharacterized protein n=1 Tax=Eumeta variegata TaxID=151549 RepID=A0A4C1STA0_EUMVA|nr:hypothetical protein EVAR_3474_1 [Eumeta japonica]
MRALVFYVFLVGCLCIPLCRTKTVRNVSARTVTKNKDIAKRATNLEENANSNNEFFPNWVPFANKNIEELGELVAVKSKPKKRLAPPMNYVLKPVADTNSEDYYDKPHEGDDGPYKLELPAIESSPNNNTLDTEEPLTTTTTSTTTTEKTTTFKTTSEPTAVEPSTPKEQVKSRNNEKKLKEKEKEKVIKKDYDADYDDEEGASKARNETQITTTEKHIPQLDEVDELKRRHEAEQRQLAEEAREEEYKIEERERDLQLFNDRRKENDFRGWGDKRADYDETDVEKTTKKPRRKVNSNGEAPRKLYSTRISPKSSNYVQERTNDNSIRKSSTDEPPRSDSDYVENDEKLYNYGKKSTLRSKQKNDNRRNKQRSSYDVTSSAPLTTGGQYELYNERIKVTPELTKEESKNNPNKINKTRKTKRRRKPKTTTDAPDSFVAESIEDTASTKATITTAAAIAPSADAVSTNTDVVVDAVSAASDHKKDGGGDHSYKRALLLQHWGDPTERANEQTNYQTVGNHLNHQATITATCGPHRNPSGVTSASSVSWVVIGYPSKRRLTLRK